jgi:uncharacterized circularly permuted ATP-grasp superfamily protein/uncharacterized alpha-E superfamily protein
MPSLLVVRCSFFIVHFMKAPECPPRLPMASSSPTLADATFALDRYPRPGAGHDELFDAGGGARPYWQGFLNGLHELGLPELDRRWREARRFLRREGVTYNVYGDERGQDRPWQLDPVPLVISAQESAALRNGLVQRARLLEAILADVYGPQRLLAERLLPPELVFANPAFLRPCHGIAWPGQRRLHLIAFDLGRRDDGSVCVLADRTQAPSGAGYCLENRLATARLLPELFHACNVQRLASFFRSSRDGLYALAPNGDSPSAVLLTPGPFNETYFEHAFLARYLGLPLVEGSDLTVRDDRVFLKQLDGLQPVDVIWRRLDDDYCDPLELRGDSFLGTPGLVQAARAGNIAIANTLGSGLVESPAQMAFLPQLCRRLLDAELIHPSVPTYWCGNEDGLAHVLAHLPRLVVKGAFRSVRHATLFGDQLTRADQERLAERIRARPWEYIGQEIVPLSTAPALGPTGLEPRRIVVRTYLAATPGGFTLMPGGLTRVSPSSDSRIVLMQHGAGSKDTWVLSDGPITAFSLLGPTGQPAALSRGGSDLPSRVADDLLWLGRYAERADGLIRLMRGILVRMTEHSGLAEVPELPRLLCALTRLSGTYPGFGGPDGAGRLAAPEAELRALVFDGERQGSLAFNVRAILRSAGSVRDRLSADMWRALSQLGHATRPPPAPATLSDLLDRLDQAVLTLAGFAGLAAESMTRAHGWRFLDIGRRLERLQHTLGLLRATLVEAPAGEAPLLEAPMLEALLEIADSAMTYRRRYLASPQAAPVLDLLFADEANPRSVHAQLLGLCATVDALPRPRGAAGPSPVQRLARALLGTAQLAQIEPLAAVDSAGRRQALDDFLARLQREVPLLSDSITHCYLSHLQPARHFAGPES